jgi:predicted Rossmann fold nucleotide-binding protein DprA/Smf involved in DNA uptake
MPPANVFDEARDALERSVRELREQLSQAEEALEKLGGKVTSRGPGRRTPGRRGPGRPKGSTNKTSSTASAAPRKRRKRRGGTRADQAVKLIESQPGISASDVAKTMKIKPNYLYRVLGDLEKEGRVKKDGRQYYPTGS